MQQPSSRKRKLLQVLFLPEQSTVLVWLCGPSICVCAPQQVVDSLRLWRRLPLQDLCFVCLESHVWNFAAHPHLRLRPQQVDNLLRLQRRRPARHPAAKLGADGGGQRLRLLQVQVPLQVPVCLRIRLRVGCSLNSTPFGFVTVQGSQCEGEKRGGKTSRPAAPPAAARARSICWRAPAPTCPPHTPAAPAGSLYTT